MKSNEFKRSLFLEIYRDKPEWSIDQVTSKVNDIANHLENGYMAHDLESPDQAFEKAEDFDEQELEEEVKKKAEELKEFTGKDAHCDCGNPVSTLALYLQKNQTAYAAFETKFRDILLEGIKEGNEFIVRDEEVLKRSCLTLASKLLQTFIEENTE